MTAHNLINHPAAFGFHQHAKLTDASDQKMTVKHQDKKYYTQSMSLPPFPFEDCLGQHEHSEADLEVRLFLVLMHLVQTTKPPRRHHCLCQLTNSLSDWLSAFLCPAVKVDSKNKNDVNCLIKIAHFESD
jgi:hypothetical protein